MPKQNQVIAIADGVKKNAVRVLTDVHQKFQKKELLSGIAKTYTPKDEEGDKLPSEVKRVQVSVKDAVTEATKALTDMYDVIAMKEKANTHCSADVVVDEQPLLKNVPVGFLLFLEKQVTDLVTFIRGLPLLDPAEEWKWSAENKCFITPPIEQVRTQKVPRNHFKFHGDEHHPPQVEVYNEDVPIGTWKTVKFSGAIPAEAQEQILERAHKLLHAVKFAREQANLTEVERNRVGDTIFSYLWGSSL